MLAGLSGNCEWYTPSKWVEMARTAMGSIDIDPASHYVAQRTVQADDWYDQERDGLKHDWPGNVWLNPPYARGLIEAFIEKVVSQFVSGITKQAVILVDSRSDTKWFHTLCSTASAVAFTKGRVNFYNQSTESSSPVSGSAFVYLGPHPDVFHTAFSMECLVLYPAAKT
jgi:phage N-6-adenine-methyltransferase